MISESNKSNFTNIADVARCPTLTGVNTSENRIKLRALLGYDFTIETRLSYDT